MFLLSGYAAAQDIRIGLVGLDTSHCIAFTKLLNDPAAKDHIAGARIVAGYPGGSPDLPSSANRLEKYTAELRDTWKLEIVNDIPALASKVDAIILTSVDGRVHLDQFKQLLAAKKPVFIDKPLAASYRDAREIARLAKEAGVPWWSASSLRFAASLSELKNVPGGLVGASSYGPAELQPTNPGFFWYGIHATEILYTLMGPGCEQVTETGTEGADVVVGRWKDGRVGVVRGIRKGPYAYGATAFGGKSVQYSDAFKDGYRPMLVEVVKFFQTRVPPVPNAETLEIMRFIEAAERSRQQGGAPVKLQDVE